MSEGQRPISYSASSISTCSVTSFQWSEATETLDYEDVMNEHATANDRDPLKIRLSFPLDDLQIYLLPRPWRTLLPVTPPEPLSVAYLIVIKTNTEYMFGFTGNP